jgi:hypothetical protein
VSRRSQARALARWEDETRSWATATARELALDLYFNRETGVRPYEVGVVLDPGERVLAEIPVGFNLDWAASAYHCEWFVPPVRAWLITSDRIVGRLADDRLQGYRWDTAVGLRVDLSARCETVSLDIENQPSPEWSGPAVAPLAVAAVFQVYGPVGLIEHPGLVPLREAEAPAN